MILKANRIALSETDVFTIINSKASSKLDLSFLEKANFVNLDDLKTDIELIKSRNFPLLRSIIRALEIGDIVLCYSKSNSTSINYVYGMDSAKTKIVKVFANVTRICKFENAVDYETGEMRQKVSIIGGYEELYNVLLGAYVGLRAQEVFRNPKTVAMLRTIYTDLFAQITSRNFGNPIDGEKFRFMVAHFFHNGDISGQELGSLLKYAPDRVKALELAHPEWFDKRPFISFSEFIDVVGKEFPTIARAELSPTTFVLNAVTGLGDNGVYVLDNFAYFLSVVVTRARRSKLFQGYMLKTIETDASLLLSSIYQAVI